MALDDYLKKDTMSKFTLECMGSMLIPFYNTYLINRDNPNLKEASKLNKYLYNTLTIGIEIGFLFSLYDAYSTHEIKGLTNIGLIAGPIARTKGIAWGLLMKEKK